MNNGKTRAGLLGAAAAYMLYIAYELYRDRGNLDTTMTPVARILFIALFVLAGAAVAVYAVCVWRRGGKAEEPERPPENKSDLK